MPSARLSLSLGGVRGSGIRDPRSPAPSGLRDAGYWTVPPHFPVFTL